jgi:hypothetical protein
MTPMTAVSAQELGTKDESDRRHREIGVASMKRAAGRPVFLR